MADLREGTFDTPDGIQLFYQAHLPIGKPIAGLLVVHGAGDHSGRYQNALKVLLPQGIAVYNFDQRGYGRSPGQRGHINAWSEYRDDLRAFINLAHKKQEGIPIFLWGYSLGALVAMDEILHDTNYLSGAIIMSAPFKPSGIAQPALMLAARMASIFWPKFSINLLTPMSKITRDREIKKAAKSDLLLHTQASARWAAESLRTVEWVKQHSGDVYLPILILHGEADQLNAVGGARQFFESVTYPDKKLITYPGGYHELHNDLIYEQVMVDMVKWIQAHIPKPEIEYPRPLESQPEMAA